MSWGGISHAKKAAAAVHDDEGGSANWQAVVAETDNRDRLEARVVWHGLLEKNSGNMLQGFHDRLFLLTSHELTYWKKSDKAGKRNSSPPPDTGLDAMNLEAVLLQADAEPRDSMGRKSESPNRASFSQASEALHKDGYALKGTILFESIRACDKNDRELELETMERSYQLRSPTPELGDAFQAGLQEAAVERGRILVRQQRKLERDKADLERDKADELQAMAAEVDARERDAAEARAGSEQKELELESLKHELESMAEREATEVTRTYGSTGLRSSERHLSLAS